MTTKEKAATPLQLPSDANRSGRWLGEEELELLREVIESGTLNSTKGTMVHRLEERFAAEHGLAHGIACASGTAAVHTALRALELPGGAEVVTTPITDMGGITPILYEGLRPVFADVDPHSGNLTAATIEAALTPRTAAIVVVHLFGNPCDMQAISALARERGLRVIEDCSQAFFAEWDGQRIGTFGDVSAFSLQQGKHMTCGEGGLVITDDPALARTARLFVNKAWPYGEADPDHLFPALNYRMTELQGAVALAQLGKLERVVRSRVQTASALHAMLDGVAGLALPLPAPGGRHVYWRYCLTVDPAHHGDVRALGKGLQERGIACAPRYIQKPAFDCKVLRDLQPPLPETARRCPGAYRMLETALVLPWNEAYGAEHVSYLGRNLRAALGADS